jgi:hypothetical protein
MRALALVLLAAAGAASAILAGACRYDPVPQEIIDTLGEETGTPSRDHRPGQPCLACHSTYEGALPALSIGGTVYTQDATGALVGAANVLISVTDSTNDTRMICTTASGNFSIDKDTWPDITFPLSVVAGGRKMRSIIGRDGSCASCHKPPAPGALPGDVGKTADSRGVVIVNADALGVGCGGAP